MPTIKDITVEKPSEKLADQCRNWPVWECGTSQFNWEYTQTEKCLIIEGRVEVTDDPPAGNSVEFGAGDYVTLPNGLKCVWTVTEAVRKYYAFD